TWPAECGPPKGPAQGERDHPGAPIGTELMPDPFEALGRVGTSSAPSFPFRMTLRAKVGPAHQQTIFVGGTVLELWGESVRAAPVASRYTFVQLVQRTGPGVIDLRATEATEITAEPVIAAPVRRPAEFFRTEIKSLWMPPD